MPVLGGRLITGVPLLFNVFSFVAASHGGLQLDSLQFADEKQEKFIRSLQSYEIVHPIKVDERYVLEKRYGNVTGTVVQSPTGNACHFMGRVEHPHLGSGSAAISTCRGL
eukprot:g34171.t1